MIKILLILLAIFLLQSHSISQSTEEEFLNGVINSANTSKDFAFQFNQPDIYTLDSSIALIGKINLNLKFNPAKPNKVTISNKTFEGFKDIIFSIEDAASITLSNCKFINCGTVYFEFGMYDSLYTNTQTKLLIKDCEFTDTELIDDSSDYFYQLYFRKVQSVGKEISLIKNVEISNCNFYMIDTSESFLTQSGYLPSRYSIFFYRQDKNVEVSSITIKNNSFQLVAPHFRNFGIIFYNDKNAVFKTAEISIDEFFSKNDTINILNNVLNTVSDDPGHGIFIQGPFKGVRVIDNVVRGFGANFLNSENQLQRDGAIHLYGGREYFYSDDIKDIDVSHNTLWSVGTGIKIAGFRNAIVNNNIINILQDPIFYDESKYFPKDMISKHDQSGINCRTGDYPEASRQSMDLSVINNKINCNYVLGCIGIDIDAVKNFVIRNNSILNPNNYGIIYHTNKGFISQEFGNSIIDKNFIDFGQQSINSLKSNWYLPHYSMSFAGINISRDFNENQKVIDFESLIISENEIRTKSNAQIVPIKIEKIESIKGIVRKKNYEILNNIF